ncbi:MAG: Ribulose-phosphate 3-epimerase [Candidatus Parcubacteria bacterium]|jgi:ribulose-phosphate 3-epimerase
MSPSSPVVIPAILAKSKAEFLQKITLLGRAEEMIHVDVMDGQFVKQKTWAKAKAIAALRTRAAFELHLMVNDPLSVMIDWMKVPGFRRAIVHVESPVQIATVIKEARLRCIEIGLAISPGTPLSALTPFLKKIDMVQVMGGVPGKSGQPLDSNTLDTVRAIHKKAPHLPIAFDIGVNRHTIPTLVHTGVTRLCAASAIFSVKNPARERATLQRIALQASK